MAILFDFNQTVLGGVHAIQKHVPEITTDVVRHVTLNTIRSYLNKYGKKYGKGDRVIICCDSGNGWRRDVFPYYKARRKQGRDKSNIDFKTVFEAMNTIREELEEFFPYRVIKVDRCEGDATDRLTDRAPGYRMVLRLALASRHGAVTRRGCPGPCDTC